MLSLQAELRRRFGDVLTGVVGKVHGATQLRDEEADGRVTRTGEEAAGE